jgi:hypothetical protein
MDVLLARRTAASRHRPRDAPAGQRLDDDERQRPEHSVEDQTVEVEVE